MTEQFCYNLANDPAIERIATPKMALTAAEYLAFEKEMHVLVILTDIQIMRMLSVKCRLLVRKFRDAADIPGYMYTDLASFMKEQEDKTVRTEVLR